MYFELSVLVERPAEEVFAFLRDKDTYQQKPNSPVLALDKTTPGPAGVGTHYREVVQMLPFFRGEILSEVTRFDPPRRLEEDFTGPGMRGHLAYEFAAGDGATLLIQRETVEMTGFAKAFGPFVRATLGTQLRYRLAGIKAELEQERQAASAATSTVLPG